MKITSIEQAKDIVRRCFCERCNQKRIKTPSGAVCDTHRIMPGVTQQELDTAEKAKQVLELPYAKAVDGYVTRCRFTIDGLEGEYRPKAEGDVAAVDSHNSNFRVKRFVKCLKPGRKTLPA